MRAFEDPQVKAVFDAHPPPVRKDTLWLRELIFDAAAATPAVGSVTETLKWGQPAYLPQKPRTGTTIRIDALRGTPPDAPGEYALFVPCQTTLIDTYRDLYGADLHLQTNRAIVFAAGQRPEAEMLQHCIALALTYHLRRRQAGKQGQR